MLKSGVVVAQELCFLTSTNEADKVISVAWLHPEAPGYLAGTAINGTATDTLDVYINATVDAEQSIFDRSLVIQPVIYFQSQKALQVKLSGIIVVQNVPNSSTV